MANCLMYATQQGDLETVLDIINNQPWLLRERERSLKTALHYSAENLDTSCCEALMMAAPDLVDSRDQDGYTPLHLAVIASNHSLMLQLLDHGADVNATDNDSHTSLHWATVCNDSESVQVLLERGGNANLGDIHGGRPLHYAVQMCGDAQSGMSTQSGSDVETDKRRSLSVVQLLILHGAEVNAPDSHGRQPIIWAASAGSPEAILALVNAGSNVEASDQDGLTALHCAASRGHMDCINTLINFCGAEVDVIDTNGCSALFYAVTLGHLEAVLLLLKFGSNPNRQDRKGRTAAHCGAAKGQLESVKALNRWGADLWQRSVRGNYPLHEAVASGRSDLLTWLLAQRPQAVNASNNDGQTLLHIAAARDHVELCQMLINAGALLNPVMKRRSGDLVTPLDVAMGKSHLHLAKVLQMMGGVPISRLTIKSAALTRPSTRALAGMDCTGKTIAVSDKPGEPIIRMRPARENEKKKIQEENKDFTVETNDEQILQVFVGEDVEIRRVKSRMRNKKRVLNRNKAKKTKKCKREKVHFSKLKCKFTNRYTDGCEISTSSAEINSETEYATESDNSYPKSSRVKKVGFKLDSSMRNESTDADKISSANEQSDNQIDAEESYEEKDYIKDTECTGVEVPEDSEWIVEEKKSDEPMAQENSSNDTEQSNVQIVEAMVHHQASVNADSSVSSASKMEDAVKSPVEAETDKEQGSLERDQSYTVDDSQKEESIENGVDEVENAGTDSGRENKEEDSGNKDINVSEDSPLADQTEEMKSDEKVESGSHDETCEIQETNEEVEEQETEADLQIETEETLEVETEENLEVETEENLEDETEENLEVETEENVDVPTEVDTQEDELVKEDDEDQEKSEGQTEEAPEETDIHSTGDELEQETQQDEESKEVDDAPEEEESHLDTEIHEQEETPQDEEPSEAHDVEPEEGPDEPEAQEDENAYDETGTFEEDESLKAAEGNEPTTEDMDVQQDDETSQLQEKEEPSYEEIDRSEADKSVSQKSASAADDVSPLKNEEQMDLGEEATLADEISASEQEATDSCLTHEATKNSRHNNTLSNSIILPLEEETATPDLDRTKRSTKSQSQEGKETSESFKDEMSRRTSKITGDSLEYTLEQGIDEVESPHDLSKTEIKSTHRGMSIIFKRTYPYGAGCRQFLDNVEKYKYFHMRNTCKSMSFTQSFQTGMKKFHMERKILSKLIELKHLQMNSKQENEISFVKRLINSYHKDGLILGIYPYKGATSFRGFEKYLYEQLWLLQRSGKGRRKKEDWGEIDLRDNHCIKITHRCSHTNQAYTELPTSAYSN